MSMNEHSRALENLLGLREGERDRIGGEWVREKANVHRYRNQVELLHDLVQSVAPVTGGNPTLAANHASYRHSLSTVLELHRRDLIKQEERSQATGARYREAALRAERLSHVYGQQQAKVQKERHVRAQKQLDHLASQAWQSGRIRTDKNHGVET